MLIDTHCHLDFPEFDSDLDSVIQRARKKEVRAFVNVGASLEGSRKSVSLAKRYQEIFASVGIHPHDAKSCRDEEFSDIKKLLDNEKVVAIGEVGLDFFRNLSDPKVQIEVFKRFIELAAQERLPLIIHCRNAQDETLSILKDFLKAGLSGVVLHCFSGGVDFLKECLDLGFFVSFTCNVTYPKAHNLREVVNFAPLDRMFLETDAPFLAPQANRGKRNEPAFIVDLAREVARIKSLDFYKVCFQTTKNAKDFFKLPV